MANQIVVSAGAKVRNLSGVLTGTSGVVSSVPLGAANGVATLDSGGKVPVSQLPSSVVTYLGTWNAATNTPTLANGTGDAGDMYICNVAGTVNFGAGPVVFVVGDWVLYGSGTWQKSSGQNGTVTSVAVTKSGDSLNITGSPITTSGTINIGFNGTNLQYVNGAGNLTTFPILTGYVTAVSGTAPVVSSGGTTPAISMAAATASVDGYLSAVNFAIFNAKQNAITLTTTGTSGASTLVGATLNIPNYGSALTGYVPYTGATQDVDLGAFKLNAQSLHIKGTGGLGHLGLKHQSASATASANEVSLFADSLGDLGWLNGNLYLSKFITSSNTAARSYTFPDATGTIALTSDLSAYVTLATTQTISGAKTFSGGVTFSSSVTTNNLTFANSGFFLTLQPPTLSVNRTVTFADITGTIAMLEGTQTFTGYKTFDAALELKYNVIPTPSSAGNIGIGSNGVGITITTKPVSTVYNNNLYFASASNTFTFPNATGTIALTSNISYPVTSVFGRTGAVLATSGDYTTAQVTESVSNLYYTDVRARASNSFVAGSGAYNSTTGVITIPTNNTQITNGANYITLGSLSFVAGSGAYNNTTGVITIPTNNNQITNGAGYTTNVGTVTSVAALTIGTSGTDISSTVATSTTTPVITLNVPTASATNRGALSSADWTTFNNKQSALTNPVTGTGTPNYLPKFTGASTIGNSAITDDGTTVTLISRALSGTSATFSGSLIANTGTGATFRAIFNTTNSLEVSNYSVTSGYQSLEIIGSPINLYTGTAGAGSATLKLTIDASGNTAIGYTTNPSLYKLDVNGTGRFSGNLRVQNASSGRYFDFVTDSSASYLDVSHSLNVRVNGASSLTTALTIASTGAATFTSSVSGHSLTIQNTNSGYYSSSDYLDNSGTEKLIVGYANSGAGALASKAIIYGTSGVGLNFYTNGSTTAKMVIDTTGNVGIGTNTPTAIGNYNALTISGTDGSFIDLRYNNTDSGRIFTNSATSLGFECLGTNPIKFSTNSGSGATERMRITSGGALCLGVTSAYGTNLLNVNGGIYATSSIAAVVAADIDMFVFQNTGATYSKACLVASMTATGGTGSYFFYGQQSTSTVALKIFSNGNIQNTNNSYGAISDARLKENIKDATPKLDDLMKVKVRNYNLKGESNKQLGVISQELEAIFPNMIEESTNMGENMKIKGVKYSVFVPMLIKAVQELKAEIEILKNK